MGATDRLGLLALAGFVLIRDADVQWAFAWSVLVALLPVGWWHYSIVSFGALAVAVARTARPERWVWLPPAFLIALLPMSLTLNRAATAPLGQAVLMAAAATAVYALGRRPAATPSTLNV